MAISHKVGSDSPNSISYSNNLLPSYLFDICDSRNMQSEIDINSPQEVQNLNVNVFNS